MKKIYNFENSANNALMAEILTRRDRQPRAAFISSLAAVMVAAISLTMVFGSLPTSAAPIEEQEQAQVSSITDGEALPPEKVTRVHTATGTDTVYVYNYSTFSETLLLPVEDNTDYPDKGKAIFDQKQQRFQWQYNGELFTFFVKDNTVYRRSEKTGKTVVVFKGYLDVALYCVTDRYLFFRANDGVLDGSNTFCYRADLITKEILRLFNYQPTGLTHIYRDYNVEFVRIEGSDVIFTHYIVHEDGSYEEIPDDKEHYPDSEKNKYLDLYYDISFEYLRLQLNDDNTISGEDDDCNCYDLGIIIKDLESLGYKFNDFSDDEGWICCDKSGYKYIYITFETVQNDTSESLLLYYGKISDAGLDGALIHASATNSRDMFFNSCKFLSKELYVGYSCYDINYEYNYEDAYFPVDFNKLTAATKSEPEYYPLENGESLTITYYPCKALHSATPDSAGE